MCAIGRFARDAGKKIVASPGFLWEPLQRFRPGGVRQIAFVATKSDRIAASDIDQLKSLLEGLVKRMKSYLEGINPRYITLSAVKSTERVPDVEDDDDAGHLTGRLIYDYSTVPPTKRSPKDGKMDYPVSRSRKIGRDTCQPTRTRFRLFIRICPSSEMRRRSRTI